MEAAIIKLVDVFKSYAGKDNQMGSKEFRTLVQTELKMFLTDTEYERRVNKLREKLDKDQDGKITFEEYFRLVTELATARAQRK